jgi:predicted RNase H-like HicB family nuclease
MTEVPDQVARLFARFRRAFRAFEDDRYECGDGIMAKWGFTVYTRQDPVDGGFVAWVRELPGCISDGDTEAEALDNLSEALLGVLAVRLEDAEPRTVNNITERELALQ